MSSNSFHLPISQHHEALVLEHFCERNSSAPLVSDSGDVEQCLLDGFRQAEL